LYDHVLCVYPYGKDTSDIGLFPPLGLELIASVLEPHSKVVEILDHRRTKRRTAQACRPETDLVCYSINWKRDLELIRSEIAAAPKDAFVLLGGRHASESVDDWFKACPRVDAIVRGDGEEAVDELARGGPKEFIAGLSWRKNGQIIHNMNRDPGPLRDDILPARHLRDRVYQIGLLGVESGITVDMVSGSRGCPFDCSFCSFNRNPWGKKREWSARSPESVVDEIAGIEASMVAFTDDLFTWDMKRVERICDLLLQRGIRKKYLINARLEVAKRPDVLKKMEKAGVAVLMIGIESVTDRTLRAMKKGFDRKRIQAYLSVLRKTDMFLHGFFILGCIGESLEEMRDIGPFAKEVGIDTMALSTLRSSPFSGLDELVARTPGYHISPSGKIFSDHCSIDELKELRRQIYREFYGPGRVMHIIRRGIRAGALQFLPRVLPRLPWLFLNTLRGNLQRSRRRKAKLAAAQATKAAGAGNCGGPA
jgi:radical SAM superfamily enzyme YgiQ (UPF0313 family)